MGTPAQVCWRCVLEQKTGQMPVQNGNSGVLGSGPTLANAGCVIAGVVTTTCGPRRPITKFTHRRVLVTMLGFLGFIGGVGLFVYGSSLDSDAPPDPRWDSGGTGYDPAGVWGLLTSK